MALFYVVVIRAASGSWNHLANQLRQDRYYLAAILVGFGTQVALFVELRTVDRRHRASAAVTAVGTGTSAAAMLACCAHHRVDLLPILGLSAGAVFLNAYKTPLFVIGIGMNVIGVIVIARQLRQARRACAVLEAAHANL